MRRLLGVWLGRRRYTPVHALQRALHAARQRGEGRDVVLLLEHEPVITLGRSAHDEHLLSPPSALRDAGVEVVTVERGGDVTLHGPGQLVAYPVLDLAPDRRDVRRYVGDLVETMRRLAQDHGVGAGPVPGLVGLWVDRQAPATWTGPESATELAKLGAVGVRIARWTTMHGFSFNVSIDLALFGHIVPCGIRAHPVTSLAALGVPAVSTATVAAAAYEHLATLLGAEREELRDESTAALDRDPSPRWLSA